MGNILCCTERVDELHTKSTLISNYFNYKDIIFTCKKADILSLKADVMINPTIGYSTKYQKRTRLATEFGEKMLLKAG